MSRPQSTYSSVPNPNDSHVGRGYGPQSNTTDFAQGNPSASSPLSGSNQQHYAAAFTEDFDASQRGSSVVGANESNDVGNHSNATTAVSPQGQLPSRNNTLKKKSSMRRNASLKRSGSKRSMKAGGLAGYGGVDSQQKADFNSAFTTPVPTQGSPTEVLANRFQSWRQLLKSLITYFREIQTSYDTRAKAAHKVQNTIANIAHPTVFMGENGLGEATRILDDFHKRSITEANKSRDIENDVISALTGLRSDLGQKIKEIKSLSGDFKNSVEKEKDGTRREVEKLQEVLQHADSEDGSATGKHDPFVVRLGVDRAVERQLDEENYLHRAYLNLESSGRELESIVVGEIQKAYNALSGILKREADDAYGAVEALRSGPIAMPKEAEWMAFVEKDQHFVDPNIPIRRVEDIEYPGRNHPAAAEVRAGMLERKSKYLKSYTPGWYVLSPTHLHEFKSADNIYSQPPVMSLYLLDQRLGSKSEDGSSSHKFMLKGKQSGGMHKGHNWVFRAETHDTMMAWYEDIRVLTEKTGEERNAYVRKHARSFSGHSEREGTVSSDGFEEDEADAVPYTADAASLTSAKQPRDERADRPPPGGRFPSDVQLSRRNDGDPDSPTSNSSEDRAAVATAGAIPGSTQQEYQHGATSRDDPFVNPTAPPTGTNYQEDYQPAYLHQQQQQQQQQPRAYEPTQTTTVASQENAKPDHYAPAPPAESNARDPSTYGDWMTPAAAGIGGAGAGVAATQAYRNHKDAEAEQDRALAETDYPSPSQEAGPRTAEAENANKGVLEGAAPVAGAGVGAGAGQDLGLGGLESEGAHETGRFLPKVVRHDTDVSVTRLHVPGKYPPE